MSDLTAASRVHAEQVKSLLFTLYGGLNPDSTFGCSEIAVFTAFFVAYLYRFGRSTARIIFFFGRFWAETLPPIAGMAIFVLTRSSNWYGQYQQKCCQIYWQKLLCFLCQKAAYSKLNGLTQSQPNYTSSCVSSSQIVFFSTEDWTTNRLSLIFLSIGIHSQNFNLEYYLVFVEKL